MICQINGLTSITRLSDKNSFKYFLISNQLVESGVPRFINKTPVLPKFILYKLKLFLLLHHLSKDYLYLICKNTAPYRDQF